MIVGGLLGAAVTIYRHRHDPIPFCRHVTHEIMHETPVLERDRGYLADGTPWQRIRWEDGRVWYTEIRNGEECGWQWSEG
jgi:hypothetical protein